jgi:hypothetical protein
MARQVVFLAVERQDGIARCQGHAKVRHWIGNPALHQGCHVDRNERSRNGNIPTLGDTPQVRQGLVRHAQFRPRTRHRLHTQRARRIHAIRVQRQHRPRDLRRSRSSRKQAQVELEQRCISTADIEIRDSATIHRRQRGVHMRVGDQNGLPVEARPQSNQQRRNQHQLEA